jgi:hypothetical protein
MSDVMSRDDKGRHYGMQNDRKNRGKMGGFVTFFGPVLIVNFNTTCSGIYSDIYSDIYSVIYHTKHHKLKVIFTTFMKKMESILIVYKTLQ